MPADGIDHLSREAILSYEELLRIVRAGVDLGIRKVRVTGGEPLVRSGCVEFIGRLSEIDGLETVALTTNGLRLPELVGDLASTGLSAVNVSLDTLDPDRYRAVTRGGRVGDAFEGLRAAVAAGFRVKINTVLLPELDDDEVEDLVELARDLDVELRFIEFMPLCGDGWSPERFRPPGEIEAFLRRRFDLAPPRESGVAEVREFADGRGRVGIIASLSRPFCGSCSRLRLSSTGTLHPCLFSRAGIPLRPALSEHEPDGKLRAAFRRAVAGKWAGNPAYTGDWDPSSASPPGEQLSIRAIGG